MKLIITLFLSVYSITVRSSTPIEKAQDVIKIHSLNSANKPLQESLEYKNTRIVENVLKMKPDSQCERTKTEEYFLPTVW